MYGDSVTVEVIKASHETSQIDFALIKNNTVRDTAPKMNKYFAKKTAESLNKKNSNKKEKNKHTNQGKNKHGKKKNK